ncbi:MAG: nitrophenyl compound nitroreductase subunit ArsF family protein [Bacteroidota bacterium]|jgi:hypothetical protein|nr:nitrophenyl compound nitroreductase subunit ArsF family protein [Bacteroidota bacterium]
MTPFALILAFILPLFAAPRAQDVTTPAASLNKKEDITVYYFHTSRRCKTCTSIERVAKNVVAERFGKDKTITFRAVNIEEKKNEALAEKYEIGGSALLVVCGDTTKDLTAKAFQYGLSDPGRLRTLIIETVNGLRKG